MHPARRLVQGLPCRVESPPPPEWAADLPSPVQRPLSRASLGIRAGSSIGMKVVVGRVTASGGRTRPGLCSFSWSYLPAGPSSVYSGLGQLFRPTDTDPPQSPLQKEKRNLAFSFLRPGDCPQVALPTLKRWPSYGLHVACGANCTERLSSMPAVPVAGSSSTSYRFLYWNITGSPYRSRITTRSW